MSEETQRSRREEREAQAAAERKKISRFALGCLEVALCLLLLAGVLVLLESKAHLSVLYLLPSYVLPLSCMAACVLALMVGMFSLGRNGLAAAALIISGWLILFTVAVAYLQNAETIYLPIPGTEKTAAMTMISTPVSSNLSIDEPLAENLLARHWKFPVHGRDIPLADQIALQENGSTVELYFNGQLWAVYDAEQEAWADVLHRTAPDPVTEETTEETT